MALTRRLPVLVLAFLAACLIGELFFVAVMLAYEGGLLRGQIASLSYFDHLWGPFLYGFGLLFYMTLLPAVIVMTLAERFSLRHVWVYLVAGAATAVVGYLMFVPSERASAMTAHAPRIVEPHPISIVATGIVAGIVYWLIAGRTAGLWRDTSRAELAS
jgi:hypothetical protein